MSKAPSSGHVSLMKVMGDKMYYYSFQKSYWPTTMCLGSAASLTHKESQVAVRNLKPLWACQKIQMMAATVWLYWVVLSFFFPKWEWDLENWRIPSLWFCFFSAPTSLNCICLSWILSIMAFETFPSAEDRRLGDHAADIASKLRDPLTAPSLKKGTPKQQNQKTQTPK